MEVLLGKSWIPNKWTHFTQINGGYPNSWMVYLFLFHGKSQKKRVDDNWGYPDDLGNFHVHKMCSKGNSRRPKKYRDWALGP